MNNDSSEIQNSHHFQYFDFVIGVIEDVVVLPEFQVSLMFLFWDLKCFHY